MATYEITAPDGKTYEVTGNGTKEEALAHFQSQWTPPASYSNEGHNRPEVVAPPETGMQRVGRLAKDTASAVGNTVKDVDVGLLKSGVDTSAMAANAHPGARLLQMLLKTKGLDPVKDAQDTSKRLYDEAGPAAFVGKVGGDIAVSGGAGNAVGDLVGSVAPKAVAGLANAVSSAAASGGLLPPGEGETRAGNALQAAAGAGVVYPLVKAGGAALRGVRNMARGKEARAARAFEEAGVDLPNVTNELQSPRTLPMTTAAASGDEAMFGVEKALRREPLRDPGRYTKLDDATNEATWNRATDILDDSMTKLPERQLAKQDAMKGAQDALDKVKLKSPDRDAIQLQLEQLRSGRAHGSKFISKNDQRALNDAIIEATNPNATLGSLARLHTNLNDPSKFNFTTGEQTNLVRDRIKALIDSRGGSAWSQAEAEFQKTLKPLAESESASGVLSTLQDPISGLAKGKSTTGIPEVTATKLRGAINQHGKDVSDPLGPVDKMATVDRARLEQLVLDKMKAENVVNSKAIPADIPGGRAQSLPTSKAQAARSMVGKLLDTRARGTREAMDSANMSVEGWEKMIKAAEADKKISARDAAMLAGILRGTGPVAGALSAGDQ